MQRDILQTTRLILRPFRLDDAETVERLAGAREIADTTLTIPHPYPPGAASAWIEQHEAMWTAGTDLIYAITQRDTAALIGAIGLTIAAPHAKAEIGYWLGMADWNHGYCTEAARALVRHGFESLGLHRIEGRHLVRNAASGRVLVKLGMKREGTHRDAIRKWDRFEDVAHYAMLATDRLEAPNEQESSVEPPRVPLPAER
jgi:RimJ/RimL family protein N-acetyltransferase